MQEQEKFQVLSLQQIESKKSSASDDENDENNERKNNNVERIKEIPSKATRDELLSCQFSSWYPIFRDDDDTDNISLKKLTPKSNSIPLPKLFINYLLSDGIKLPQCCDEEIQYDDEWSDDDNDDDNSNEENSSTEDTQNNYSFPKLTSTINESIQKLGGNNGVFPKLNYSSPKDANWIMSNRSLKCKNANDVYLLLKASDFISWDILHSGIDDQMDKKDENDNDDCNSVFHLVLRKWCNLNPSMEFRCFVYDDELVAISQRNHTTYYQHLKTQEKIIKENIQTFFKLYIKNESRFILSNYIFDCYVSEKNNKIWIIDFNMFCQHTDPLLFTWEDVVSIINGTNDSTGASGSNNYDENTTSTSSTNTDIVMRIATEERKITMDPLSSYRAPVDTVDLACLENGINFEEFRKLCERPAC